MGGASPAGEGGQMASDRVTNPGQAAPANGGAAFDYFGHDADIGIVGRGPSPEAAMEQAARAMFAIMADPASFHDETRVEIAFDEDDLEYALVTWLNAILAEAGAAEIMPARLALCRDGSHWRGECAGSPWQPGMERGTEVKGATLTMAAVEPCDGGWEARCVVDV